MNTPGSNIDALLAQMQLLYLEFVRRLCEMRSSAYMWAVTQDAGCEVQAQRGAGMPKVKKIMKIAPKISYCVSKAELLEVP